MKPGKVGLNQATVGKQRSRVFLREPESKGTSLAEPTRGHHTAGKVSPLQALKKLLNREAFSCPSPTTSRSEKSNWEQLIKDLQHVKAPQADAVENKSLRESSGEEMELGDTYNESEVSDMEFECSLCAREE